MFAAIVGPVVGYCLVMRFFLTALVLIYYQCDCWPQATRFALRGSSYASCRIGVRGHLGNLPLTEDFPSGSWWRAIVYIRDGVMRGHHLGAMWG